MIEIYKGMETIYTYSIHQDKSVYVHHISLHLIAKGPITAAYLEIPDVYK